MNWFWLLGILVIEIQSWHILLSWVLDLNKTSLTMLTSLTSFGYRTRTHACKLYFIFLILRMNQSKSLLSSIRLSFVWTYFSFIKSLELNKLQRWYRIICPPYSLFNFFKKFEIYLNRGNQMKERLVELFYGPSFPLPPPGPTSNNTSRRICQKWRMIAVIITLLYRLL